jgi:hypothetical protein
MVDLHASDDFVVRSGEPQRLNVTRTTPRLQFVETALGCYLETDVMPLNRQCGSNAAHLIALEGFPCTSGPVVDAVLFAFEAPLKQVAVLPDVVKKTGDPCLPGCPIRLSESRCSVGHSGKVCAERLGLPLLVLAVRQKAPRLTFRCLLHLIPSTDASVLTDLG